MSGFSVTIQRKDVNRSKIEANVRALENGFVKVGFPSGGPISSESINVAQKAAFNEYGSAEHNVPPRPFMKQAMELNRQKLRWLSAGLMSRVQRLLLSPRQALGILGEAHSGQIRSTIQTDGHFARNAPSTIAKKGDDKPLIETSQMMNAITHKVVLK